MKDYLPISAAKYQGPFGKNEIKHLLKRTLFGFNIDSINELKGKSLDELVEKILSPATVPAPPLNFYQSLVVDQTGVKYGETWVNAPSDSGGSNGRRIQSWRGWWLHNMHFQGTSIHEKMILFWHNHFATEVDAYRDPRKGYIYTETIRKYALGNFKDLVKAITLDPAMLVYLNGTKNTKAAPDENYARELQELFTLGKGPASKYTEEDVKAAARVLTGFRVRSEPIETYFQSSSHDDGDKVFSDFYQNKIIKGRRGADAPLELDELLDMIFANVEVSKFIVRKLYTFFIYYEIDEAIENNFIAPLAQLFRENNYEISPLLKAIFSSNHFYDPHVRGAAIKNPLDYILHSTRLFEASWPDESNILEYYLFANDLNNVAKACEQDLGNPPSVAGWEAYYQSPQYYKMWINTNTIAKRAEFTDKLIMQGFKRNGKSLQLNLMAFAQKLENPQDPNLLIDEIEFLMFQLPLADSLKKQLKTETLLSGQSSDYYWTELWNEAIQNTNSATARMATERLKSLIAYLASLPEYQLH